ncbi:aspartate/glutamate racemase family protein [Achromobacter aloeverae]|uniref:Asp/Glu racemase n=1 Tax=Achromobacter aloeverae TaxID=1750518 RepID=A0A4V1MRP8_9BURK|nr:aspartate/glutamate racemase family protein [Achromobacter aloeverae]RXN85391.1 Asp/Glu racemase [Achromobacter aloeverae]
MTKTLYVINPNSNTDVTAGIAAALDPLRSADGPRIECVTLAEGPLGIQTQEDVDRASVLVRQFAELHRDDAAGFVTACFSDPGLHSIREIPGVLALGISECGVLTALSMGLRVGVIAILDISIPRHLRTWAAMGVKDRIVGELAIGRTVAELSDRKATLDAMIRTGTTLRDTCHADVLVMGCAGMAPYRQLLQDAVGLPVVEPTQAAVAMALGRLRLGW